MCCCVALAMPSRTNAFFSASSSLRSHLTIVISETPIASATSHCRTCKKNPNVILFVDEVHHIDRVGASEGCVSASQILKPALARNEIRMIGATTTTESTDLLKDQAFARRFSAIEVPALTGEAALDTARHILQYYSTYHNVSTDVSADNLLMQVRFHLPDTVFPDNFINLVDETFAGAVFDGLSKVGAEQFYQTLSRLSGRLIICADEASALQAS